jgi:rhodanese-related sulfurtransferase
VALFLTEKGFCARALVGGFNGWRDAGLPLANAE